MVKLPASCDIIIPTYNNASVIAQVITTLFEQSTPASWHWRIIISDDGSTDQTVDTLRTLQRQSPWPVQIITNPHRGSAAARNQALKQSLADVILLLGGDILLQPGALQAHADFHEQFHEEKYAAVGHVTWDPRVQPSPFQEWMTHGGPQNDFDALLGEATADSSHYFYGSHLSLKRSLLVSDTFQEKFSTYGWEDIELGRRLKKRGLVLKPLFSARSLHHHRYTVADIQQRQRAAGHSLRLYQQLHPEVPLLPSITWRTWFKFYLLQGSGAVLALRFFLRYSGERRSTPRLFFFLTTVEYWRGILKAQHS